MCAPLPGRIRPAMRAVVVVAVLVEDDIDGGMTNQSRSILLVLLLLVATACAGDGVEKAASGPVPPKPRNVIFIVIDALRADHLGAYGYERDTTPNLDALAGRSILFTRAYSAASWTLPSLASYMTSVYPSVHGLRRPPTAEDHSALSREFITLAESLKEAGYQTASITSQPWITDNMGLTQGFDMVRAVSHASAPGEAQVLTEALIEWLGKKRDPGFFLYAHYMGPHSPYDVPSEFTGRYTTSRPVPEIVARFHKLYEFESEAEAYKTIVDRAARGDLSSEAISYMRDEYDEKLAFTDASLGLLFDHLEHSGLMEDTLVIVTADHGEAFYEHGTIFHGQHIHEELVRVPLIIHLPGGATGATRLDEIVELIDIYPTIHELLELPTPPYIQGESLIPLLQGGPSDGVAFSEGFGFKIITPGWSSFYDYSDMLHRMDGFRITAMYDLAQDPFEQTDIAGISPPEAERHRELAFHLWGEMLDIKDGYSFDSRPVQIDTEVIEELEALGYLGGGS
jgi:arylsulfatase A-like enzyme